VLGRLCQELLARRCAQHSLCRVALSDAGQAPLSCGVERVAHVRRHLHVGTRTACFMVTPVWRCAGICTLLPLSWHAASAKGEWKERCTAGGPKGSPAFKHNPRYLVCPKGSAASIWVGIEQAGPPQPPWFAPRLGSAAATSAPGLARTCAGGQPAHRRTVQHNERVRACRTRAGTLAAWNLPIPSQHSLTDAAARTFCAKVRAGARHVRRERGA
jgi:hypothetical protein